MIDFDFVCPTRLVFGKKKEEEIGRIAASYGFKKTLILFGSDRVRSYLLPLVEKKLEEEGVSYVEKGGVRPNPTISFVREALALARKENVDFVLALGGGSVIDTAKSVSASFYYEGDPFDFNKKTAKVGKTLPIGTILTISSAGSEMSNSCVIQDDEIKVKVGFNSDKIRPLFSILNPELTYSVPEYQTSAGISDTMMHSLERYFDPSEGDQLADAWALALVKSTMKAGKKALEDPHDYEARATLMLNSSLSHNGYTGIGKQFGFVVHPIEHAMSGYCADIVHGAGVALIFPAWARHVYKRDLPKFARLARELFDIREQDDEKASIIGIDAMETYFASIGMPTSLKEVGLGKSDIPALANLATGNGTRVIGCCHQSLDVNDVEAILSRLAQ